MMYSEFYERTKTEVSYEEYHFIEESYYEFDGNKDEFCKAWLKDRKSGKWSMELRFRKALDEQKAEYEKQLAEKEENLIFYREYTESLRKSCEIANKKIGRATEILKVIGAKIEDVENELA